MIGLTMSINNEFSPDFHSIYSNRNVIFLFVSFFICRSSRTTLRPNTIWLTSQSHQWVASLTTVKLTMTSSWSRAVALVHANVSSHCVNHWSLTPNGQLWNKSNWNSSIPHQRWDTVVSKHQPTNWHSWVHSRRIASAKSKLKPPLLQPKQPKFNSLQLFIVSALWLH